MWAQIARAARKSKGKVVARGMIKAFDCRVSFINSPSLVRPGSVR
jgi:hypothetical protein